MGGGASGGGGDEDGGEDEHEEDITDALPYVQRRSKFSSGAVRWVMGDEGSGGAGKA